MRIRVVDYVGSLGGGVRFCAEVVRALTDSHPEEEFELVSYGTCLERYRDVLRQKGLTLRLAEVRPRNAVLNFRNHHILGGQAGRLAQKLLTPLTKWHYDIPAEVFADCDRVWMPWIHWHRADAGCMDRVVGSFHDTIVFDVSGIVPLRVANAERVNIARWLASDACVVVSSRSTATRLGGLFHTPASRLSIVRMSAAHASGSSRRQVEPSWSWISSPFLLNAANTNKHKNHEVLFEGVAKWGTRYPLVLTGEGSDLAIGRRGLYLRQRASRLGLVAGRSLHPLGYVPDDVYHVLLKRAWALVVASKAEGGGSFPAWEALEGGVPVICAETSAVREHLEWLGAEVLWFHPDRPEELADRLAELEQDYDRFKARAVTQRASLRQRSWKDVANDYWGLLTSGNDTNPHQSSSDMSP